MYAGDTRGITHLLLSVVTSTLLSCTVEHPDALCGAEDGDAAQEEWASNPAIPVSIAAGGPHTCVLLDDSTVRCWGRNAEGQLGIGSTAESRLAEPTKVPRLRDVTQVALGGNHDQSHSCALLKSGTMRCWGSGSSAQLGDGAFANQASPVCVPGLSGIEEIGLGFAQTCARLSSGEVWCWGFNLGGQLGGGTMDAIVPTFVRVGGDQRGGFARIVLGGGFTCGLTRNQELYCWGDNREGQLGNNQDSQTVTSPTQVVGLSRRDPPVQIAAGYNHACTRLRSGSVLCWGRNADGQLGTGTLVNAYTPQRVQGLPDDVTQIAAGGHNTCAIRTDGSVWCWGRTDWRQGGNPKPDCGSVNPGDKPNPVPKRIAGVENAIHLAVGGFHSCAILKSNAVVCWGRNTQCQLGIGKSNDPNCEQCYADAQRVALP